MGIRRGFRGCRRGKGHPSVNGMGAGEAEAGCGAGPNSRYRLSLESISQAQTRVRLNLKAVSRSPSDTNAPVDASASPAPIPLTHNVSSHLHHLYPIQKKRKMACRIYRHTNQYTRPHYLDFILKCGLCWIICAIVNPSQTIFLRISEISISRDFFLSLAWKGQRTRLPIHVRVTIYNPKYLTPDSNIFISCSP